MAPRRPGARHHARDLRRRMDRRRSRHPRLARDLPRRLDRRLRVRQRRADLDPSRRKHHGMALCDRRGDRRRGCPVISGEARRRRADEQDLARCAD